MAKGIRVLPTVRIPIVEVSLPEIRIPEFPPKIPRLNPQDAELVRYGLMDDLADLVPVVGDPLADMAYAELQKRMTPDQYAKFKEDNKWLPSSFAALKVIAEGKT